MDPVFIKINGDIFNIQSNKIRRTHERIKKNNNYFYGSSPDGQ